jgi:cytochrome c oxidase assembly protein subunit 15
VLFHLPLPVAVAHNAGGAALLLTMVLVNYHARTSLVRVKQPPFAGASARVNKRPGP